MPSWFVNNSPRRLWFSALGVAVAALAADQFIPGGGSPGSASASPPVQADSQGERTRDEPKAAVLSLSARMRSSDPGYIDGTGDLFVVPQSWLPELPSKPVAASEPELPALPPLPTLTGVMISQSEGASVAKLDGSIVRVGQVHRGWVLASVQSQTVTVVDTSTGREVIVHIKNP